MKKPALPKDYKIPKKIDLEAKGRELLDQSAHEMLTRFLKKGVVTQRGLKSAISGFVPEAEGDLFTKLAE